MQEPQHTEYKALEARVEGLERCFARMREAYVKNDLGAEDYDGHRRDHFVRIEQDKVVTNYKRTITGNALWALLVGLATITGLGVLDWLKSHIK